MSDLRLVTDVPNQVIISILEETLKRAKTGEIQGITIISIDKGKHVDVRTKWDAPVNKLEIAGSLRVAQQLVDKLLLGNASDPIMRETHNTKVRRANKKEVQAIIDNRCPVFIAKAMNSLVKKTMYLVLPKELPDGLDEGVIINDFESEREAREYCRFHQLPCDLKLAVWS